MSLWEPLDLVNVIVTGSIESDDYRNKLNLPRLSESLLNSEYYPKSFAALKLCRVAPFAKALVFRSGKMVVVGSISIEQANDNLRYFEKQIQSVAGSSYVVNEVTVQNMVASSRLKNPETKINLLAFVKSLKRWSQFEPE